MTGPEEYEAAGALCSVEPCLSDEYMTALGLAALHASPEGSFGFTQAEVTMLSVFGGQNAVFSPEESLAFVRVLGAPVGRIAEAAQSCTFEPAGRRMIKGFADPVTVLSLAR
ncbi:MAG: hypothetical protein ACKVHU_07605 [Acidimicrobiales bacterium]|jgi:hypothetical protein